jgi:hypothetical protein
MTKHAGNVGRISMIENARNMHLNGRWMKIVTYVYKKCSGRSDPGGERPLHTLKNQDSGL